MRVCLFVFFCFCFVFSFFVLLPLGLLRVVLKVLGLFSKIVVGESGRVALLFSCMRHGMKRVGILRNQMFDRVRMLSIKCKDLISRLN